MTTTTKLTLRELRAEAQRLGITAESAGCSIEELLRTARDCDDPLGYLAIYAPPDAADEVPTSAGEEPDEEDDGGEAAAEPAETPQSEPPVMVSLTAPLAQADLQDCYISTHVEVRLTRAQGLALRRLHLALDADGARMAGGRRVIHLADAVKWLLDKLAAPQK
jgi:hypothetical protein